MPVVLVQSCGANSAAQSLLSTGHFGDGEDGADGCGGAFHGALRHCRVRAAFLRAYRAADLALVADGKTGQVVWQRQCENNTRRLDGLFALADETTRAELFDLCGV